jgi:hypothetical protein
VPIIATFDGITIYMYYRDHPPPHFHVLYAELEAEMAIATLEVLAGKLPAAILRKVRDWAAPRQAALALNWVKCQSHLSPERL